jgi:hypothetical protein
MEVGNPGLPAAEGGDVDAGGGGAPSQSVTGLTELHQVVEGSAVLESVVHPVPFIGWLPGGYDRGNLLPGAPYRGSPQFPLNAIPHGTQRAMKAVPVARPQSTQ